MTSEAIELDRARALADRLDYFLEEDLVLLTGAAPATIESWRKRHQGPRCVRFGNRYLYPRAFVAEHLANLADAKPAGNFTPKDLL